MGKNRHKRNTTRQRRTASDPTSQISQDTAVYVSVLIFSMCPAAEVQEVVSAYHDSGE